MPKRDPHEVLGVPRGATQAAIKAAWRRLARTNHPDLTADDPDAVASATRRMAEINRAYAELRVAVPDAGDAGNGRSHGPPPERPTRPVTGRVDTTATFRQRNTTTGPAPHHASRPPFRSDRLRREPLRASQPSGPLARGRRRGFRPVEPPPVDVARGVVVAFGKFHGHSLGEIADFEPSYVDWLARTISRDPDLVAAARAIQADLDARGVDRRSRPPES